jgi:membrane-associated phospholipid phosphatase
MQKINRLNIIIPVLSLVVFAIIAYLTNYVGVFNNFDLNAIVFFHDIAVGHSLILPKFITDLGYLPGISVVLIILCVLLSYYKQYKEAVLLTLAMHSGYLASGGFKEIFERLRPALEYQLVPVEGYSFPSGHSILSVCFYGTLIYIIFKLIKINWLKYTLSALLILLILLIGLSRIYLGVHYPTDAAAGLFLGIFILFFWINLYNLKAS